MKPAPFDYHAPETLEEVLHLLAEHGDEAKIIAGGQSLVPMLSMRLARPAQLIDVNGVAGLAGIELTDGALAHRGHHPGARRRAVAAGGAERLPVLPRRCPLIGHVAIRNRGTVGGEHRPRRRLGRAAGGGAGHRRRPGRAGAARGERVVPADEFFLGHFTTALDDDECLVEVDLPATDRSRGLVGPGGRPSPRRLRPGRGGGHGRPRRRRRHRRGPHLPVRGRRPPAAGRRGRGRPWWARRPTADDLRRGGGRRRAGPRRPADDIHGIGRLPPPPRRGRGAPGARRRHRAGTHQPEGAGMTAELGSPSTARPGGRPPSRPARTLADLLRDDLGLTGTHLGCEHGVCGACTVLLDGDAGALVPHAGGAGRGAARSRTVEGLADGDAAPPGAAGASASATSFQCGFCTPGFVMTTVALLGDEPDRRRGRDPGGALRQPLPLHRLREHRRRRAPRRRATRVGQADPG